VVAAVVLSRMRWALASAITSLLGVLAVWLIMDRWNLGPAYWVSALAVPTWFAARLQLMDLSLRRKDQLVQANVARVRRGLEDLNQTPTQRLAGLEDQDLPDDAYWATRAKLEEQHDEDRSRI
jgi:hypothetical protein